jgi:hypothetical protein
MNVVDHKILIHCLKEGYIITDYTGGEKYARETVDGVIGVIKKILIEPPNDVILDQNVLPQNKEAEPIKPEPEVPQEPEKESCLQKIKALAKDGFFIPRFKYDPTQKKEIEGYLNISVVEMPDGRAVVIYKGTHYYTTKEKVLRIPYQVTKKYFNGYGLSSVAQTCIRAYRHYLNGQQEAHEHEVEVNAPEIDDGNVKPKLEFFKEDSGFDYASVNPQYIGGSTVYRSKAGKLVVKYQGKNTQGELLLTRVQDIEKLMDYNKKDVDWAIRGLSAEKRNVLRGYLRDLKALDRVAQ